MISLVPRTLTGRLIIGSVAMVIISLGLFVVLVKWRLEQGAVRQQDAVELLAERRFAQQISVETQLAHALVHQLRKEVDRAVAALAVAPQTATITERRNIVPIEMALKVASTSTALDGLYLLDAKGILIGSHRPQHVLQAAHKQLDESGILSRINGMKDVASRTAEREKPISFLLSFGREELVDLALISSDQDVVHGSVHGFLIHLGRPSDT